MAINDNMNESGPVPSVPLIDENSPALDRHTGRVAANRKASGGLSDSPDIENPVRDSNPIGKVR